MIKEILEYQKVDAELKEIENKLFASEDRKKASSAKKYLESVDEILNKLNNKASELAEQFKIITEEQAKFKEQKDEFAHALDNMSNADEATYLVKKTDELLNKIKTLSSQANMISEEIQAVIKEYVSIKNKTKNAQTQLMDSGKKYNEFKASFSEQRTVLENKLATLAKSVDAELMNKYLSKRQAKIFPIVYGVRQTHPKEMVCGACNMQLSMSLINRLKNGEIIDCEQCGRLLYLEDAVK